MENKLQASCLKISLDLYAKRNHIKGRVCALRNMVSGIANACSCCSNATVKANCTLKRNVYIDIR